jgi:hypothetical protein
MYIYCIGVANPDQYGSTVNLSGWIRIRESSLLTFIIFFTEIRV